MKINLVAAYGLGLFLASCHATFGQQSSGELNTLWEAVQQSYPGLKLKKTDVEAAKIEERTVLGERLPQLRAQAQNSYATFEGISGAFFPQPGLFNVSGANGLTGSSWTFNTYASSTLEWEIFSFGKNTLKTKAAQAKTHNTESDKDAYSLNLQKELSVRYLQWLFKEAKLETNQQNVDRLNTIRSITSALSRAGLKSAADSLMASSSFNQAVGANEKLQGERQAALILLTELTNDKRPEYHGPTSTFLSPMGISLNTATEINPNHPVLTALEDQRQNLEWRGKSEARAALPSLKLIGGVTYRGVGIDNDGKVSDNWNDGFSNSATNALVGVGITWNISDLYTRNQRAEGLIKQAESEGYRYQNYKQQMQAQLSSVQNKLIRQYREVEKTNAAQQQANDAYAMYLSRYKSGLMDLSNLLQIQLLLEQAENSHIDAAFNFWMLMATEAELTADFSHLFNTL